MTIFDHLISGGHTVLILGDDVKMLMDRIQNPSESSVKCIPAVENTSMYLATPEIWIVSLPPDACERSAHLERRRWTATGDQLMQLLNLLNCDILVQPEHMLRVMNMKIGMSLMPDPENESYAAITRMMVNVNVKDCSPASVASQMERALYVGYSSRLTR